MRIAYAILSPIILLGGCATPGMGPHTDRGQEQRMANCPMAAAHAAGDQQRDTARGDHAQMMGQGQMQGMHMANCPMAGSTPPAPEQTPADPHQH